MSALNVLSHGLLGEGGGSEPCPDITIPVESDVRFGTVYGEDDLLLGQLTVNNYFDNPTPPSFSVETILLESAVGLIVELNSAVK